MKKIFFTILLILVLPLTAYAEDFTITIDFKNELILSKNKDLIFNINNLNPGDTYRYNLIIDNVSNYDFSVYIRQITNDLPENELNNFVFSFYDGNKLLFSGGYQALINNLLMLSLANTSKTLVLEIYFDKNAGNEYQGMPYHIGFEFMVKATDDISSSSSDLPSTGESRLLYYILFGTTFFTALLMLIVLLRKKENENEEEKARY